MKLLLDTHSFLWFISGDSRLGDRALALIEDGSNQIYLSIASLWEIAIKISLGKLSLSEPFESLIPKQLAQNVIDVLDIQVVHCARVVSLPFHHRDPFDRLLVAQAQVELLSLVSADTSFDAYGIERIW